LRYFVTGAAGFIGSNLVDRLLEQGHSVTGFDNLSTGRLQFLDDAQKHAQFKLVLGDTLDSAALAEALAGCDVVFHLAANADVRFGTSHPHKDLEQNTVATFNVLEAMRGSGVSRIAFASTGSVYGEPEVFPTPESAPFPIQTSFYGASKLACEGLIQAYCAGFGFQAHIFRFVSVLGQRYSHGHVFDFYSSLMKNPTQLQVLGDGHQRKSYVSVQDCIEAMSVALEKACQPINVFNLGTDETCEVQDSVRWIIDELQVEPEIIYSGGSRGWIGDSPFIFLDCTRIKSLGWKAKHSIREGVVATLDYLRANPWLLEAKA